MPAPSVDAGELFDVLDQRIAVLRTPGQLVSTNTLRSDDPLIPRTVIHHSYTLRYIERMSFSSPVAKDRSAVAPGLRSFPPETSN